MWATIMHADHGREKGLKMYGVEACENDLMHRLWCTGQGCAKRRTISYP